MEKQSAKQTAKEIAKHDVQYDAGRHAGKYIVSIDQSTQGTKALLFNERGELCMRTDLPHKQIVNGKGWVSHDGEEIYQNTIQVIKNVLNIAKVNPDEVAGIGISNQRETGIMWERETGKPSDYAVVWQCARAAQICERKEISGMAGKIREKTGLQLSPYFTAAKICWLLENVKGAKEKAKDHNICHGTMDSYLIYRLTKGEVYATDYSNASRTQLFNIFTLTWDKEICGSFDGGLPCGAFRTELPLRRQDKGDLWNRLLHYDEHRGKAHIEQQRPGDVAGMGHQREAGVCSGGKFELHRGGNHLAERQRALN